MIRHVVMFRKAAAAQFSEIERILLTLPPAIPTIRHFQVGRTTIAKAHRNGDHWDVVLIADFDTWDALFAYEAHPYHLDVVAKLTPMFTARAITDFTFGS
jgi:hypothetical protein